MKPFLVVSEGTELTCTPVCMAKLCCLRSLVLLLVIALFWPAESAAQEKSPVKAESSKTEPQTQTYEEPRRVEGVVTDNAGQGIADCVMFCSVRNFDGALQKLSSRTDAQGRFTISFPADVPNLRLATWIFKPGYALRVVDFAAELPADGAWLDAKIVLHESTRISLLAIDPMGKPVKSAAVEPQLYEVPNRSFIANVPRGRVSHVPAEIKELTRIVTDDEGLAECTFADLRLLVSISVSNDEFGSQTFAIRGKNTITAQLDRCGSIDGKIVAADPSQFAGSKLLIETRPRSRKTTGAQPMTSIARVTVDSRGAFHIPALAEGSLFIEMGDWPHKDIAVPELAITQMIAAGQRHQLDIPTVRTVAVSGRVVKSDGTPAASVGISAMSEGGSYGGFATTNNDGLYKMYVRPGSMTANVDQLPTLMGLRHAAPEGKSLVVTEETRGPIELETIMLKEELRTRLHFHEASQRPHANQRIVMGYELRRSFYLFKELETDGYGCVTLPLSLDHELELPDCPVKFFLNNEVDRNSPDKSKAFKVVRREPNQLWLERDEVFNQDIYSGAPFQR